MARLKELYRQSARPDLANELALGIFLAAPRLEKVVINTGLGEVKDSQKGLDDLVANLAKITGQKPVITKARKSIAGFKIRAGQSVGARVTLRDERMYDFVDRLVNIALPRLRDFRGLSMSGFDGHGNYNLGIREHTIFPEIHYDDVDKLYGFNITTVTSAKTDEQAYQLLRKLGFPFETKGT